jgi:hypothetical protein
MYYEKIVQSSVSDFSGESKECPPGAKTKPIRLRAPREPLQAREPEPRSLAELLKLTRFSRHSAQAPTLQRLFAEFKNQESPTKKIRWLENNWQQLLPFAIRVNELITAWQAERDQPRKKKKQEVVHGDAEDPADLDEVFETVGERDYPERLFKRPRLRSTLTKTKRGNTLEFGYEHKQVNPEKEAAEVFELIEDDDKTDRSPSDDEPERSVDELDDELDDGV